MLTQARLKELLHYNPLTGIFTRCSYVNGAGRVGTAVGAPDTKGYLRVMLDGTSYLLHRLAVLYVEGYTPEYQVDHKDGIVTANKWTNLRHVSGTCNQQNCQLGKNNISGFIGVWQTGKTSWASAITVKGKQTYLGSYTDVISAALARCYYESCCPDWTCNHQAHNFTKLKSLGYAV